MTRIESFGNFLLHDETVREKEREEEKPYLHTKKRKLENTCISTSKRKDLVSAGNK